MRFSLANLVFGGVESCVGHGAGYLETELIVDGIMKILQFNGDSQSV